MYQRVTSSLYLPRSIEFIHFFEANEHCLGGPILYGTSQINHKGTVRILQENGQASQVKAKKNRWEEYMSSTVVMVLKAASGLGTT